MRLYKDGVFINSVSGGGIASSTTVFQIAGANGNTIRYFNGSLDDVRVYNRALSANEIAAIYHAGSAGNVAERKAAPATLQRLMEQLALAEGHAGDTLPALVAESLRQVDVGTAVVLVTTRPTDLADSTRFAEVWSDHVLRDRVRRILCIDTSSARLADYFAAE